MKTIGVLWALCCCLLLGALPAAAAEPELKVGIKVAPPFAMQGENGDWTGLSVGLWNQIAEQQGWQTRWVPLDSARAQIEALESGAIDVAVGALSMTPEREARMNFSHAFYSTGLAIATPVQDSSWLALLGQIASPTFLSAVGALVVLLFVVGAILWLVEHKHNREQFGRTVAEGLGDGFWWSAVTMTTVGYGDKAPVTFAGRVVATIWMFVSVITISSFTAAIASAVTMNQMQTLVQGAADLGRVHTLAVAGSTGEQSLLERGVVPRTVATAEEGLELLRSGRVDAFVYDRAILQYLLREDGDSIELLDYSGMREEYALGMRNGFEHREALNLALLEATRSSRWQQSLLQYFGGH